MKKFILGFLATSFLVACGDKNDEPQNGNGNQQNVLPAKKLKLSVLLL